jgi:hypothetical protein
VTRFSPWPLFFCVLIEGREPQGQSGCVVEEKYFLVKDLIQLLRSSSVLVHEVVAALTELFLPHVETSIVSKFVGQLKEKL